MTYATITYRPDGQKTPGLFDAVLTTDVLKDICRRITGQNRFKVVKDTSTYNKGRLLLLEWYGCRHYVSLSEAEISGRNSSMQSVPTAINIFYADNSPNKVLHYYFVPHTGNAFTDYHLFVYRLLMTAGVNFLNINDYYSYMIVPYTSVDEIIQDRKENQRSNSSNNSSYVSRTMNTIEIYGKVYGASKYESTLLTLAVAHIADKPVELYNICEQDLKQLPQSSFDTIAGLDNVSVHYTSLFFNKRQFVESEDRNVLRSSAYHYNLFMRIGYKKCALCGCEIPQIIQGAHIWGVSEISHTGLSDEEKFQHATSGHNGLWLCQNHHKLFDSDIILFAPDGQILVQDTIQPGHIDFIRTITNRNVLSGNVLSNEFCWYLSQRNSTKEKIRCHKLFA